MALNGISTATSTTTTLTKILRRDLKLAAAQIKRQSLTTSTWYRPLHSLNGTHSAYVNGSSGATLETLSGSASPTSGHPWSTGTVSTYSVSIRSFNTGTNIAGDVITTCNEGDTIYIELDWANLTVPGGEHSYLQLSGMGITAQDLLLFGTATDPIPWGTDNPIGPVGPVGASMMVVADNLTEGNETLNWTWYVNSATVTSTSVTIVDTSRSPITPLLSLDAGDPDSYSGTGTVWTDTVGKMPFDLINGPTYNSANGGYLHFTPSGGQYAISTSTLGTLANWTIEAWHYYDGTNTADGDCIFTEDYHGGDINLTLGAVDSQPGDLQTAYYRGGWHATNSGYKLTTSTWHHVVGTFDGAALKLYVDGTLVNSTTDAGPAGTANNRGYRLMSRWDAGGLWGGRLSVVRVYNTATSQTYIAGTYNSEKSRYGL
jgi:hypothetical protein